MVVRWLKRWKETKDLTDRGKPGRPRITTRQQDEVIIDTVRQDIDEGITSQKIQEQVLDENIDVSTRTIRRRLGEPEFKYMKPLSKSPIFNQNERMGLSIFQWLWSDHLL